MSCRHFSSHHGLSSYVLYGILWSTTVFKFNEVFTFCCFSCTFAVISENPRPDPRLWRFTLMCSNKSFVVIFRPLIHFELIFVKSIKSVSMLFFSLFSFDCGCMFSCSRTVCWKDYSFFIELLLWSVSYTCVGLFLFFFQFYWDTIGIQNTVLV